MLPRFHASRMAHIHPKATNVLAERLPELRGARLEPINLATARPNFDTPPLVKAAAAAALDEPITYILYTDSRGLGELREAIAGKLLADNGIVADHSSELLVTAGTHEALTVALLASVDAGQEVILFDPSWVAYQGMVRIAGGTPVFAPLSDARLDAERLRALVTPRTKAILFNNPNNPSGTVFDDTELAAIAAVAHDFDLLVIVDEIYEHFLYDGRTHRSIATLPGMRDRTVTINGLSKAYAMTGWRIGYAAGPAEVIGAMLAVHQHVISSPCSFAQKGAVTAFGAARESYRPMVESYRRRRDLLAPGLASLPNVHAPPPEGACFFFLEVACDMTSSALSERFLTLGGLMLTPGSAFGPSGDRHLRLSFAGLPEEQVPEVLRRLEGVLSTLDPPSPQLLGRETR